VPPSLEPKLPLKLTGQWSR